MLTSWFRRNVRGGEDRTGRGPWRQPRRTGPRLEALEDRTVLDAALPIDLNWAGGALAGPATASTQSFFSLGRTYNISAETPAALDDFVISYYRSIDQIFGNGDDVLIGTETITDQADKVPGLHSGTTPEFQIDAVGTYHLFALLDSGLVVTETDDANNVQQAPDPVTVAGDLNWSGGGLTAPAAALVKALFTVGRSYTVAGDAAGELSIAYYASADDTLGNGDDVLIGTEVITAAEGRAVGTHTGTSPNLRIDAVGTYRLFARLDSEGEVLETDEANNVQQAPDPVTVAIDLNWDGGSLSGPSAATTAATFTVSRTYSVSGDAAGELSIAYYASADDTLGNGDDVLIGTEVITAAEGRAVGTHTGTSPNLRIDAVGTYRLFARLDTANAVRETDESNNVQQAAQTLTISQPTTLPLIIDNGGSGYSETGGGWTYYVGQGLNNTISYAAAGTGSNTATWQVGGLAAGAYDVQATWTAFPNRASNARYKVFDGSTLIDTVVVNQELAPAGSTVVNGVTFQSLGAFSITSGTLKVVLSDDANEYVIADALRVAPIPPSTIDLNWAGGSLVAPARANTLAPFSLSRSYTITGGTADSFTIAYYASSDATLGNGDDVLIGTEAVTEAARRSAGTHAGTSPGLQITSGGTYRLFARLDSTGTVFETSETNNVQQGAQPITVTGPVLIDNVENSSLDIVTGYTELGGGWTYYVGQGFNNTISYAAAGTGSNTATWQVTDLPEDYYDIQMTWTGFSNRASNARYTIYDGTTLLAVVEVNQERSPEGEVSINGVTFQSLGAFSITSGTLKVVLSDDANEYVIADAMRITKSYASLREDIQAYYRFGQAPGTKAIDQTRQGNDLTPSFALDSSDLDFRIGLGNNGSWGLQGAVAAAGKWDRVLSSGEKAALYNGGNSALTYTSVSQTSLRNGLLAWWDLDEPTGNGTREDSTGRGNDLAAFGSPTRVAGPSGVGYATHFNGSSQFLWHEDTADLRTGRASWTVTAWVSLDSIANTDSLAHIMGKFDGGFSVEWLLYYHYRTERSWWYVDLGYATDDPNLATVPATNAGHPNASAWYFVLSEYNYQTNTLSISVNNGTPNSMSQVAVGHQVQGAIGTATQFPDSYQFDGVNVPAGRSGPKHFFHPGSEGLSGGDNDYTVVSWLRFDSLNHDMSIMGFYDRIGTKIDWNLYFQASTRRLYFQVSDGGGSNFAFAHVTIDDTTNWHFLAMWYDQTARKVYLSLDDADPVSADVTFTPTTTDTEFRIGSQVNGDPHNYLQFTGRLQGFGKWGRVLTAKERSDLYNNGTPVLGPY